MQKIKDKERITILNALRAGVVPPVGLRHIQVGRAQEIAEIVKDLDHLTNGGSTIRFVVGDFGAGKSFFLTLCKLMAHEKRMVVIQGDITTERILCASDGRARALLTELLKNMSCRSRPEGNALKFVIESWIGNLLDANPEPTPVDFQKALSSLSNLTLSQDFAKVLYIYLQAYRSQDDVKLEQCLKWIRAEYETRTEAKSDLGVSKIVEDSDFYNMLKLMGAFTKLAGFSGFVVLVDELAVLVRQRAPLRNKNYETLLTIINDCLQGSFEGIGFLFGATGEAVEDREKGLFSYGALETRLGGNRYAKDGIRDLSGPVMRLDSLSKEELMVLLHKLRSIDANFEAGAHLIDDPGIQAFFDQTMSTLGAAAHLSPRDIIKDYLNLFAVLRAAPGKSWRDFIGSGTAVTRSSPEASQGLVKLRVE